MFDECHPQNGDLDRVSNLPCIENHTPVIARQTGIGVLTRDFMFSLIRLTGWSARSFSCLIYIANVIMVVPYNGHCLTYFGV
jgi:hypothetical protein